MFPPSAGVKLSSSGHTLPVKVIFCTSFINVHVCFFPLLATEKKIDFNIQIITSQIPVVYLGLGENPPTPFYVCKKPLHSSSLSLEYEHKEPDPTACVALNGEEA